MLKFKEVEKGKYEYELGELLPNISMKIIGVKRLEGGYIASLYINDIKSIEWSGSSLEITTTFILLEMQDNLIISQKKNKELYDYLNILATNKEN